MGHVLDFQGLPGADEANAGMPAASAVSSVVWPFNTIVGVLDEGNPPVFG